MNGKCNVQEYKRSVSPFIALQETCFIKRIENQFNSRARTPTGPNNNLIDKQNKTKTKKILKQILNISIT